jgi:hypothetical protein
MMRAALAETQVIRARLSLASNDAADALEWLDRADATMRAVAVESPLEVGETFATYELRLLGLEWDVVRVAALTSQGRTDAALDLWRRTTARAASLGTSRKLVEFASLLAPFRRAAGKAADEDAPLPVRERWEQEADE